MILNNQKLVKRVMFTTSVIALSTAFAASPSQAQTVTSTADGETITNAAGNVNSVVGAPAVLVVNNDVILQNDGILSTTGITQTVEITTPTTGAIINNNAGATITGDSRAVQIDGEQIFHLAILPLTIVQAV